MPNTTTQNDPSEGVFAEAQTSPQVTETQPSTQATETPSVAGAATAPPAAPATISGLTKEDLEKIVTTATKQVAQAAPQQAQPQRQWTQEEFNRAFNVFNADEDLVTQVLAGGPKAVEALNRVVTGVVRQATTMAAYQMQQMRDELEGRITPLQAAHQAQNEERLLGRFLDTHNDLKGFEVLIKHVAQGLQANGRRFDTEKAAFDHVANEVRTLVKQFAGSGQGQQGQQTQQQTQQTGASSTMATLSSGSQMAGRPATGAKKAGPAGIEVFD